MTLHATLRTNAENYPERIWLRFEDRQWTYAEAAALIDRIAAGLLATGVNSGDSVALLFTNCPELVFCYFACFRIGAIAVPLNTRFQQSELVYALNHCGATILIGQAGLVTPLLAAREQIPAVAHIFVDVAPQADVASAFPDIALGQLATLLYTSGTTARPKGVMHSHATLLRQNANYFANNGRDIYEQTLVMLPLCHIGGLSVLLLPATEAGGTVTLLPAFEPRAVLRCMAENKITYAGGLPVHVNALINCPDAASYDLSSLRLFHSGGDCVPVEMQKRFHALFGVNVDEICGMTEVIYTMQPYYARERRPGSIGKPIGDVQIRLQDASGQDVGPGEIGEMIIHSGAVTLGYWADVDSTSAALRNGGMNTGDLARRDADGFLWFAGRSKDIIIRGGSNISPGEVEDVLYAHPAIFEASVIGVPDNELGQRVRAYVTLKPGTHATAAELIAWAAQKLAAYKVPESVVFLETLPKGLTGKVHKKTLRELAMVEPGELQQSA